MKKKIWASLDDFFPPEGDLKVGRSFANHNFIRSLWKHGTFEEYHFFLGGVSHQRLFREKHGPELDSAALRSRVKLFCRSDLPRQVRKEEYTVFHQSDPIRLFNLLCHFRNFHGSFPVTAFIHSLSYPGFFGKYLEMLLGGATVRDAIICSSTSGKEVLSRMFAQLAGRLRLPPPAVRLEVIPFGLEGEGLDRMDKKECRRALGWGESEVIGLCLGRFSDYDKMDLFPLLQAFQRIYPPGLSWRLVLAGAVGSADYVRMLKLWIRALGISEGVRIRTDPSEEEKHSLYRAADFFISPSDNLQETFGITLLEAMAAGLPLIVSDFDGYRDIATPDMARKIPTRWGKIGFLGPEGYAPLLDEAMLHRFYAQSVSVSMNELAGALKELFSQPRLCAEMGERARRRFEENYTAPVVIRRLENFWLTLRKEFPPLQERPPGNPIFPDFHHAFSHYVTGILNRSDRVRATGFAASLLEIGSPYPLLPDMGQMVDWEEVKRMIRHASGGKKVGEILRFSGGDEEKAYYQVLWMLKHGLLEVI